jgi:hypothetical protein
MPVRPIKIGELGKLGVDDGQKLYWDGVAVVTEQRFTLGTFERILAGLAAAGTLIGALWPIAQYFGFLGLHLPK